MRIRAAAVDCDAGRVILRGSFDPHRSHLAVRLDLGDPSGPVELPVVGRVTSREITVALPDDACSLAGTFRLLVERRATRDDDGKQEAEDKGDVQLLSVLDLTLSARGQPGPPGPPGQFDPAVVAALQSQIATALALASPVITTASPLPNPSAGKPYDEPLAATGGSPPYAWSLLGGGLPTGLALDATTGRIAGTLAAGGAGSYQPVVQVIDQNGHLGQKTLSLTVDQGSSALLDVVFLVDSTGDMNPSLANLRANIANTLMPSILSTRPASAFGVASCKDFPLDPFGDLGDYPYRVEQTLTTNNFSVHTAVSGLTAVGGNDAPESGTEALYLAATGGGVSWPASSGRPSGSVPAVPFGFRTGSGRVIVAITNASFHDGPEYVAAGIAGAHSEAQAIQALNGAGIFVIGAAVDATYPSGPSRPVLERYARATGAVVPVTRFPGGTLCATGVGGAGRPPDPDGMCPLVFDVSQAGTGLSTAVTQGINLLLATP